MTVNVQDHRSMLLQTDDEFRQLAAKHKELEAAPRGTRRARPTSPNPNTSNRPRSRSGSSSSRTGWKTSCARFAGPAVPQALPA